MAQRSQVAFLHCVLRIDRVTQEIARQRIDRIEMRQRGLAKTLRFGRIIARRLVHRDLTVLRQPRGVLRKIQHGAILPLRFHCAAAAETVSGHERTEGVEGRRRARPCRQDLCGRLAFTFSWPWSVIAYLLRPRKCSSGEEIAENEIYSRRRVETPNGSRNGVVRSSNKMQAAGPQASRLDGVGVGSVTTGRVARQLRPAERIWLRAET